MTAAPAGGGAKKQGRIAQETLRVLRDAGHGPLPVVTVSWARSVTGAIAAADGVRTPLSGPEALLLTHRLRAMHDAILVGIRTVLSDDPLLSVRLVEGSQPQPVVLDSHLRFPLHARLLSRTDRKPWIFHLESTGGAHGAAPEHARALAAAGARLFPVRCREGRARSSPRARRAPCRRCPHSHGGRRGARTGLVHLRGPRIPGGDHGEPDPHRGDRWAADAGDRALPAGALRRGPGRVDGSQSAQYRSICPRMISREPSSEGAAAGMVWLRRRVPPHDEVGLAFLPM